MKTAVRQLTFLVGDSSPYYIDLAECLSLVNRQAYRQGYVYLVESFTWQNSNPSSLNVISLPTSWTVYNSWKKAKRLWDKMNRQAGLKRSCIIRIGRISPIYFLWMGVWLHSRTLGENGSIHSM